MAEAAKLRIVGRRIELDAGLARALLARGIAQLAVDGDQVRVSGDFTLPGGTLHIRCRELLGDQAVIDVSGPPPPSPSTARAADGQTGQDGAAGTTGGVLRIVCQHMLAPPRLLACGSAGGDSQAGGHGVQPTTPAARNGAFNRSKSSGRFGGRVLKRFGLSYFLSVAYGEPGRDGARGGDGWPPGRPGDGGDGGRIDVTTGETAPATVDAHVEPGAPGACGAPGKGAQGGDGGLGGVNRLYRYQWFKPTLSLPMTSGNAEVAWARKAFRLAPRAASGRAGPDGSDSVRQFVASAGKAGVIRCRAVMPAELAACFDADFLRQASAWAEQSLACAECQMAETIVRWALSLLDADAAPSETGALRQSLQQLLSRIRPSPETAPPLTA